MGFLHIRGGVSAGFWNATPYGRFSPHTWRCFSFRTVSLLISKVFSTYVEVFPYRLELKAAWLRFLHIRGGVSFSWPCYKIRRLFSPHTWRCFWCPAYQRYRERVFSTYVEVFPLVVVHVILKFCFLHIRGGVSMLTITSNAISGFSPHTWRCFKDALISFPEGWVFSTYVEVF